MSTSREKRPCSRKHVRQTARPQDHAGRDCKTFIADHTDRDRKTLIAYLALSVFCIVFDRVYSLFAHGVGSAYMTFAFIYPLIGGVGVYLIVRRWDNLSPGKLAYDAYNSGIATLALGSILAGIFQIAGTASRFQNIYTGVGWSMVIIAVAIVIFTTKNKGNSRSH